MTILPRFVPKEGDQTQFDPSVLPWTIVPQHPKGKLATVFNAANEPIGTLEAYSHSHLIEMARTIEDHMRKVTELEDELVEFQRIERDRERNAERRKSWRWP